jgi:hypothetical protein
MRVRRVPALQHHAAVVGVAGAGWRSGPLLVARTHRERFRGLRPRPRGRGLLLAGRSVHGRGMREGLRVVSLDAAGRVRRVALLRPRGVFVDRGARWILELPLESGAPAEGTALKVRQWPWGPGKRRVCWHT